MAPMTSWNYTANDTVSYCDYFELSEGYRFTEIDNMIVYVASKVGGVRDVFFKGVAATSQDIYWDWDTLATLVEEF